MVNWRDYITVDPEVCHGKACVTGTRVLVTTILDNLAAGLDAEDIVQSYPSISRESVQAAVSYAADLAKERVVSMLAQGNRVRFKLDENLPVELAEVFRLAGHDAVTVLDQGIGGIKDPALASECFRERRAVVTLDMDFADIRAYPPSEHSGIVVFRLRSQARDQILEVGTRLLRSLPSAKLEGALWIVEEAQIRVRE